MRAADIAFVGALTHRFPVLLPILQEHVDFHEELLPHVFLGEVTGWIEAEFVAHGPTEAVRAILDFIDLCYATAGEHERELIGVSFLENLPRDGEEGAGIRELLGPASQEQLKLFG